MKTHVSMILQEHKINKNERLWLVDHSEFLNGVFVRW